MSEFTWLGGRGGGLLWVVCGLTHYPQKHLGVWGEGGGGGGGVSLDCVCIRVSMDIFVKCGREALIPCVGQSSSPPK